MYRVVYPGGITVRSEPRFEAKMPGRVARLGDAIEGKEDRKNAGWIELKDGTYIPMKGPNNEKLVERMESSDNKTTAYMERFRQGLDALGISGAEDDPFISQYTNTKKSKLLNTIPSLTHTTNAPTVADSQYAHSELKASGEMGVIGKLQVSDRNVLCMSVHVNEVVLGTADHALYAVDLSRKLKVGRKLYTKTSGHSEWVTCVTHERETGRVLSGGMDGKICVWEGTQARDLVGHVGSISQLREISGLLLSSSYDRSLRCWSLKTRKLIAEFQGHRGAVLDFYVNGNSILSCGRDSVAMLWDIQTATEKRKFKDHGGHVTCGVFRDEVIATGAQDGKIRFWDARTSSPTLVVDSHTRGAAVTGMEISGEKLISCAADGRVNIFDCRSPETSLVQWQDDHGNFIYSMKVIGEDVVTGGGDGTVVRRGVVNGERKSKVKCDTNAIRCIDTWKSNLVVAGDDGNLIVLN